MIGITDSRRVKTVIIHGQEVEIPDYLADQASGMSEIPQIPPGYKLRRILHENPGQQLEIDFYVPADWQGFVHLQSYRLIAWVLPERIPKLTMLRREAIELVEQIRDVVAQEYQDVKPSRYLWGIRVREHSMPYGGSTRRVVDVNFAQPIATLCGPPDNWVALANRISRALHV